MNRPTKIVLIGLYGYFHQILYGCLALLPPILRYPFYKMTFAKFGREVFVDSNNYFRFPRRISIGSRVAINRGCSFYAGFFSRDARIVIEDDVAIAPEVTFLAASHDMRALDLPDTGAPILVKKHAWICARATVLAGVTIGEGAVVAAGSVVTADVDPYTVVAGVPARFLRARKVRNSP